MQRSEKKEMSEPFLKCMQKDDAVTAIRGDREAVWREVRKLLEEGWHEISQADYVAFIGHEPFAEEAAA
jgi:hypothetical protein